MKPKHFILTILLALQGTCLVSGQEADPPANELERTLDPAMVRKSIDSLEYQKKVLNRVFGWEGVLPKVKRIDNPLHLLNPLAPARYGDGYDNVTLDDNGNATGIRLIGISF